MPSHIVVKTNALVGSSRKFLDFDLRVKILSLSSHMHQMPVEMVNVFFNHLGERDFVSLVVTAQ